ncbi:sodium:solute symporter, partial [Streptomyces koyangensis]
PAGALPAAPPVANTPFGARRRAAAGGGAPAPAGGPHDEVRGNRLFILIMGAAVIVIAIALNDVVQALTVAYNLLVGGLLIPILGGLLWKRGTVQGALTSVAVGGLTVSALMWHYGILADQPIYYGLLASLAAYVVVSLLTPPTDPAVLATWRERLAGRGAPESAGAPAEEADAAPGAYAEAHPGTGDGR